MDDLEKLRELRDATTEYVALSEQVDRLHDEGSPTEVDALIVEREAARERFHRAHAAIPRWRARH